MSPRRLAGGFLLCSVAVLLATACGDPATKQQEHLEAAEAYEEAGRLREARIELRNALKLSPQDPEINYRLGFLASKAEAVGDARFYFEEALRLDPTHSDAALGAARMYLGADNERARELVEGVIEREPDLPLAYIQLADIAMLEDDFESALRAALTAAELDPGFAFAHYQVGLVYKATAVHARRTGGTPSDLDYKAAIAAFERAARTQDPQFRPVKAWGQIAQVYQAWKGHAQDVEAAYKKGLEALSGERPQQLILLAEAREYGARSSPEIMAWALRETVELNPSDYAAWRGLGALENVTGGDGDAEMARMLELQGGDPRALGAYARYLNADGRKDEALAFLEESMAGGDEPVLLVELALLHAQLGDAEGLRGARDRLARAEPDSANMSYVEYLDASAEGRLDDAAAALHRWLEIEENTRALRFLTDVELRRGRPDLALEAVDRALELADRGTRTTAFLLERGRVQVHLGDYNGAVLSFRAASRRGSVPEKYWGPWARALYGSGRIAPARRLLERAMEDGRVPLLQVPIRYAQYFGTENPELARKGLLSAQKRAPRHVGILSLLVQLDLQENNLAAAEERVDRVLARDPGSPDVRLLKARLLRRRGELEAAAELARQVLDDSPSHEGASTLLVALLDQQGRREEAVAALEAQDVSALPTGSRLLLARLYVQDGRREEAIALLERVVEEEPDLAAPANDLAYLLVQEDRDLDRALSLAQRARAGRPNVSDIADTLGFVQLRRGLPNAALAEFNAAIDLAPASSSAWARAQYHRGLALRDLEREAEALEAVELALASGASFPEQEQARLLLRELVLAQESTGESS